MEFEDIIMKRYATKLFDGRQIPKESEERLLKMVRYSASSFNVQPWKIIIITDKTLKEKLKHATLNQAQITSCSHLLVFCANLNINKHIDMVYQLKVESGISPKDAQNYTDRIKEFEKKRTKEQKLAWAQRQIYIALSNALNGAKSLGLDSCPMEGFDAEEYSKILELPEDIVPTVLCTIGYAADKQPQKLRFKESEIFQFMR